MLHMHIYRINFCCNVRLLEEKKNSPSLQLQLCHCVYVNIFNTVGIIAGAALHNTFLNMQTFSCRVVKHKLSLIGE